MVQAHGLAASIRAAEESETFDLANQTASTIANTVETAFSEPFQIKDMIRITLVIGAGKQARQMYDAKALNAVTSTLQTTCGFVEDRGASCVIECAGSYKLQHDTGKNLKTVVVFPKVKPPLSSSSGMTKSSDQHEEEESSIQPLLSPTSPEYKLAVCSMKVFENMILSKCGTWLQKRNCVAKLDDVRKQLSELDDLLMKGTPLTTAQQDLYDSMSQLDDKRDYIHAAMQQHIEQSQVTSMELNMLRTQNAQRISQLEKSDDGGNANKMSKAMQRKELLDSITTTIPLPKLRHHAAMGKLYKEMGPLVKLENETRGRLLSVKETQSIGRLEEIREELEQLERASREWFEDDEMFETRVKSARDEYSRFLPHGGSSGKGKSAGSIGARTATVSATTKTRVPVNKWVIPTKGAASAKKKSKLKKGDLFGAMMMDSDDESDDDSTDGNNQVNEVVRQSGPKSTKLTSDATKDEDKKSANGSTEKSSNDNSSKKKKKSTKKKGKGGKPASSTNAGEKEVLQGNESKDRDEEGQVSATALSQVISFLQAYVIPLILAFLGWIVSLLFGTNKKKKRKND